MTDNVVGLHGAVHSVDGEPNPTVVEELERLLEAAKAGEIVGLVGTYLHRNKAVTFSYAGPVAGFAVIGGLECAKDRLMRLASRQD